MPPAAAWGSLSQTGNWNTYTQDIDKNAAVNVKQTTNAQDFTDLDDARTYNAANEYTGTVTNGRKVGTGGGYTASSPNFNTSYDAVGNLINDQINYQYTYDAFGRLVSVTDRATPTANKISEYKYNGLGFRTGWHYDTDADGTVETGTPGDDPWYWLCYDTKWRVVGTYRHTDDEPKERFIHNNAGLAGAGNSSYIDSVILRDTDNNAFNAASDEVLTARSYLLQNWRADVVALVDDIGDPVEYVRYSPYGVPTSYPVADVNRDGAVNATDSSDWNSGTPRNGAVTHADLNKDGLYPDTTDYDLFTAEYASGKAGGYKKQSSVNNRIGYAGYQWDPAIKGDHVRHRVYMAEMGRWTRRDPAVYKDGLNLLWYSKNIPTLLTDPTGLLSSDCSSGKCGGAGGPVAIVISPPSWCWPEPCPYQPQVPFLSPDSPECRAECAAPVPGGIAPAGSTPTIPGGAVPLYSCICMSNIKDALERSHRTSTHVPGGWPKAEPILRTCVTRHEGYHGSHQGGSLACQECRGLEIEVGCLDEGKCGTNQDCQALVAWRKIELVPKRNCFCDRCDRQTREQQDFPTPDEVCYSY